MDIQEKKTKKDKFHVKHHVDFVQHPLEGEVYQKAKIDVESQALPGWFNKTFDFVTVQRYYSFIPFGTTFRVDLLP